MRACFLLFVVFAGCSLSHASDDTGVPSADVTLAERDAPRDVGRDAPPVESPLARVLRCDLSDEDALTAMVRHQSCLARREFASVGGFYEAWEAGLFSALEPGYTSFDPGLGCEAWRCILSARSCMDAQLCENMARPCGAGGAPYCEGERFVTCGPLGGRAFDCTQLGARCTDEGCALDGCVFRPGDNYQLGCDEDDLVLCEGAIRVDCGAMGRSCGSFAVGGEVPTLWCSPPDFGGAGAYGSPIECTAGRIEFMSVSGRVVAYDCVAAGYAGCDEWGCMP